MLPPGFRRLEWVTGVVVAVVATACAAGPGWLAAAEHVTAARLGLPIGLAPGHGALAELALLLPIGEAGFRVSLVSALAAGALAAGVIAMVRALVPREVGAGIGVVIALAGVAAMRIAATTPGPAMLAAAGVAWAVAGLIQMRRESDGAGRAVLGLTIALAAAPWIGVALALAIVPMVWTRRRALLLVPVVVMIPLVLVGGIAPLMVGEVGDRIRGLIGGLGGDGGVVVLGAGALGLGFAAATGLRGASIVVLAAILVAIGALVSRITGVEAAIALLPILALGIAVLATAAVRVAGATSDGTRRSLLALAMSVPFAALAVALTGAVPDDADAPARAASDLVDSAPAGPGGVIVGDDALLTALRHERAIAGLRPDLGLGRRGEASDRAAVGMMRQALIVISDLPAFGVLDGRLSRPSGRGFQLLMVRGDSDAAAPEPARYPGAIGASVAGRLALARGLWEAGAGRLGEAARAAGLVGTRFDAGSVAVLAVTEPSLARPALYGFVPQLGTAGVQVSLDLLGDDLAWVGNLREPPLPASAPPERRLHARWRAVLAGIAPPADPAIRALGKAAVTATRTMLTETGREEAAAKLAP